MRRQRRIFSLIAKLWRQASSLAFVSLHPRQLRPQARFDRALTSCRGACAKRRLLDSVLDTGTATTFVVRISACPSK